MKKEPTNTIPKAIKFISSSLFLFMIGRGLGTDTYFSLYVKSILGSSWGVTLIGALLALIKLIFSVPIGALNKKEDTKDILLFWKILYALCGFFFFMAGFYSSPVFLVLAVILNGIASSTTFTTYRNYYDKNATNENRSQIFWLYFSSMNIAEIVGAVISAVLVSYLELPFMYLFVIIFSLLSLVQEQKIKDRLKKNLQFLRRKKKRNLNLIKNVSNTEYFFWEKGFIQNYFKKSFSLKPWKKMVAMLKTYPKYFFSGIWSITLVNILNYIGFLFIPVISAENNLNLSQIALVFAIMKLPYLVNIIVGNLGDRFNKKTLISIILTAMSSCYVILWTCSGFILTLVLTFLISLGIALLNPICSALVSTMSKEKDKGQMAWVQEWASKLGEILWALGFWILASIVGTSWGFITVGIAVFVLWCTLFVKNLFVKSE